MVAPSTISGVDGPQPPEGPSPRRRTPAWKRAIRLAFVLAAVGGLVWLLDHIGWATIGSFLDALGWGGVGILFALGIGEALADAAAFQAATPAPVSLVRILAINQAGSLANRFIPWEVGEVLKGTLLSRHVSGTDAVTGTVVWNYLFRITKPAAALSAALLGWLFGDGELVWLAGWMMLASLLAFLPYVGLRIAFWLGVTGGIVRALQKLRILRKDPERTLQRARAIDEAVRRFWHERPRDYAKAVSFQFVARLLSWLSLYAALTLIDPAYDLATSGGVWAAMSVMTYIVALFPARLGTEEGGAYAVFKLSGLDPALGVTAQLMLTVKTIVLNAALGALALVGPARRPAGREDHPAGVEARPAEE